MKDNHRMSYGVNINNDPLIIADLSGHDRGYEVWFNPEDVSTVLGYYRDLVSHVRKESAGRITLNMSRLEDGYIGIVCNPAIPDNGRIDIDQTLDLLKNRLVFAAQLTPPGQNP